LLIYSKEVPERRNFAGHWRLIDEASREGVFVAAEPLDGPTIAPVARPGRLQTDGPFAETKEQLAGFYILDCQSEGEAVKWAERVLSTCDGMQRVEVRRMPGMPERRSG
jgi:hypothetical protein